MEIIFPILIILVCAKIIGEIFVRMRQPPIIGEMLAGVVLGPSLLNLISPEVNGIEVLAELGIFFLLFLAGMQINLASFREYSRPAIYIAIMGNNLAIGAGIVVGFIFKLDIVNTFFIAIVFSLTALPVGVKILMDLGKIASPTGKIIITSAVLDDLLSMFFFAIVLSFVEENPENQNAWFFTILVLKILLFLVIIYFLNKLLTKSVFPINHIKMRISKLTNESQFFVILLFAILLGFIGNLLEISFAIGIFYAGTIIKNSTVGEGVFSNVHNIVSSITSNFFSPILFAYLGLLLNLFLLFDPASPFSDQNIQQGIFLLTAIVFAMVGKGLGAFTGGVLANMKLKDAAAVGIGLNARGLMGLMISGIGLKHGLIDMNVYAMLVTICIITTFITPYGLKRFLS